MVTLSWTSMTPKTAILHDTTGFNSLQRAAKETPPLASMLLKSQRLPCLSATVQLDRTVRCTAPVQAWSQGNTVVAHDSRSNHAEDCKSHLPDLTCRSLPHPTRHPHEMGQSSTGRPACACRTRQTFDSLLLQGVCPKLCRQLCWLRAGCMEHAESRHLGSACAVQAEHHLGIKP